MLMDVATKWVSGMSNNPGEHVEQNRAGLYGSPFLGSIRE